MSDLGALPVGSTAVLNFTTMVNGVPTTLAGSPVISIYKNSTTQSTSGVTLTVDYDSVTGLNHVVIDTSSDGTFYATDTNFSVVITTGTVGGGSVVGSVVGSFSLTTEATRMQKTAGSIGRGTVTTGASTTSIPTSAFTPAGAVLNQFKDRVVLFDADTTTTTLRGATATISASSNAAAPTFTVSALPATPASGDTFSVI